MMNNSATKKNKPFTMSIKNLISPSPQKVSPVYVASPEVMYSKKQVKVVTPTEKFGGPTRPTQKTMHTPASGSKEVAAPPLPQKPVHRHRKSGTIGHPAAAAAAAGTADRRALRKIKRRLFLEAVKSEQPTRIKSPRNPIHHEVIGKKNRTGLE